MFQETLQFQKAIVFYYNRQTGGKVSGHVPLPTQHMS